jgi:hypothetical protein
MKKFDEFDDNEQRTYKKRSKRASNRPGEGIRILNSYVEEEDYYVLDLEDSVDSQDEVNYNKTS